MEVDKTVMADGDGEADKGDECDPDPHALERCDSHDSWIDWMLWERVCTVELLKRWMVRVWWEY